jgi:hypothetical protein
MKVWNSFGSEHSANLVIIGKFKSGAEAEKANAVLDELTRIARDYYEKHPKGSLAKPMMDAVMKHEVELSAEDADGLAYDFDATVEGDQLVITTEDKAIQAFIMIMLRHGAKIEMYSAHQHPGKYGR